MFYSKCGKILSNGSQIIDCSDCPCGYFGLFGIKYRQYQFNWETYKYQPLCRWNYYLVIAEIKDNTITISKGSRKSFCMSINRNLGKVGNITKMWDCKGQEECYQYDWNNPTEDWDYPCLQWVQYWQCQQVVDFQVYNLLGCFQSLQELSNAMGCGEADANGNFPLMLEKDGNGNWVNTSVANNCINNTWNKQFEKKYMLNFTFNYSVLGVCVWQNVYEAFMAYAQYCDEETGQCWLYEDHQQACGGAAYVLSAPNDTQTDYLAIETGGYYGVNKDWCGSDYPCYQENCSDMVSVTEALGDTGNHIMSILADRSKYGVYSNSAWYYNAKDTYAKNLQCNGSNNTCIRMNWNSGCHDNYYWSTTTATFIFRTAEFSVSANQNTPSDAIGVKLRIRRENNKWNHGKGNESDNIVVSEEILFLPFGEVYKFPLHTNINTISTVETPQCSENGVQVVSGGWQIQPYCMNGGALNNGGDQSQLLGETDNVYIEALQYFGVTGEA